MNKQDLQSRVKLVDSFDIDEFRKLLSDLSNNYHNKTIKNEKDEITLEDNDYDSLLEIYRQKFGEEYNKIGFIPGGNIFKETLPKYMGSLNKIKTEEELNRWIKKYSGPYVITDKIDGISALYNGKKLWTRGDGKVGTNISHILKYLNLPRIKQDCLVRGELYIPKKIFEQKYKLDTRYTIYSV